MLEFALVDTSKRLFIYFLLLGRILIGSMALSQVSLYFSTDDSDLQESCHNLTVEKCSILECYTPKIIQWREGCADL